MRCSLDGVRFCLLPLLGMFLKGDWTIGPWDFVWTGNGDSFFAVGLCRIFSIMFLKQGTSGFIFGLGQEGLDFILFLALCRLGIGSLFWCATVRCSLDCVRCAIRCRTVRPCAGLCAKKIIRYFNDNLCTRLWDRKVNDIVHFYDVVLRYHSSSSYKSYRTNRSVASRVVQVHRTHPPGVNDTVVNITILYDASTCL